MSEFFLELFSEEIPVNLQKIPERPFYKILKIFLKKKILFFLVKAYLFQHQIDF